MRCLQWSPFLAPTSSCPSFRSFRLSRSPRLALFHVPFVSVLFPTSLATFLMNSFFVRHELFGCTSTELSLPSCPRTLFVSPRAHSLSKNALIFFLRSVIADSYSSAGLFLPWCLRLLPLPRPLVLVLLFVLMGFGVSQRLGHSIVTLLCLLSWRPLPGLLPLSLLLLYLSDMQFSLQGFGLGLVVAVGSEV